MLNVALATQRNVTQGPWQWQDRELKLTARVLCETVCNSSFPAGPKLDQSFRVGGQGANGLQVLWEDGERTFCRRVTQAGANPTTVLAVVAAVKFTSWYPERSKTTAS